MTLKEKLDGKLPPLSSVIWNELESVFLDIEPKQLSKGVTISVYKNATKSHFCYNPDFLETPQGTMFSLDFDTETLNEVISIAEANGIVVEKVNDTSKYYKFIYAPSWK